MTKIFDSHHHIWLLKDIAWLQGPMQPRIFGDYEALRRDYTIEDFRADLAASDVSGSVYIQVNWPPGGEVAEARWVQAVAEENGWPHGIVGYADFNDPDCGAVLEELSGLSRMRGIRQQLHWHENEQYRFAPVPDLMNDAQWRRGFGLLADYGWTFELQVFAAQMKDAARLARDFPAIPMALQHCGMPEDTSPPGMRLWRDGMERLAQEPNIHCKLSGLGTFIHRNDPAFIADIVGQSVDLFGAGRCFYGSNYPIEKIWSAYAPIADAFRRAVSGFSAVDQAKLLHDNARAFYRIEI